MADSIAPFTPPVASFVLRTRGDPTALSASVRREIRAIDATVHSARGLGVLGLVATGA